jgi:hypothetical protein
MSAFRRVEGHRAGPRALGILVPPGQPTLVILRPRALEWDLIPVKFQGMHSGFCQFDRDEAAAMARKIQRSLETSAASPAQVVANPGGDGFLVWVPAVDLMWLVCPRLPGRPYEPLIFPSQEKGDDAVRRLAPFLWPALDAQQEYYFNTQNFSRSVS